MMVGNSLYVVTRYKTRGGPVFSAVHSHGMDFSLDGTML